MATAFKPEEFIPEEQTNLPVQRATIEQIDGNRRRALDLFAEGFDLLQKAGEVAHNAAVSGQLTNATNWPRELERLLMPSGYGAPSERREKFLTGVTQGLDRAIWNHLLAATDLEKLMDKQARDDFRNQLDKDPPAATAENCYTTLSALIADADDIFRRGIANAFSKLDRRFRSHDGFKIGTRIALSNTFADYGGWNQYTRHEETIRDVERTFHILDGKEHPERAAGIIGEIDDARRGIGFGRSAFEVEDEYFRAKAFKNGNLHLWFKRKDLVESVNKLLGEYYGSTLGEGADTAQPDAKKAHSLRPVEGHAKNFGFFPTSPEIAGRVLEIGEMTRISPDLTILEPSAGTGALITAMLEAGASTKNITAIEIQEDMASQLRAAGLGSVMSRDFLSCTPEEIGQFDRVVMNPPFDRGRDTDHVLHALKFVKPGGKLIAIMAAGVEFREDAKAVEVRAVAESWKPIWFDAFRDLPPRSFAHAGTNVNTVVLAIQKPHDGNGK